MDSKTKGAWIVHHAKKLQTVTNVSDYEQINFAGKCGMFLSSISVSQSSSLSDKQVAALAQAVNVSVKLELPQILLELERQKLISIGESGIEVIGTTTSAVLNHATTIFDESSPHRRENAVVELAEKSSILPLNSEIAKEYVGDTFKFPDAASGEILQAAEVIGFVDAEEIRGGDKLYFNGNLFRREDASKIEAVCSSLTAAEVSKMTELDNELGSQGCVSLKQVHKIIGEDLLKKLHSIGLYDVNRVGNEQGSFSFVTKPSAFSKFGRSIADDAFDLAKAFVTSLTYGMTQSHAGRGRIRMICALMQKLTAGEWVGPATAIGQDYKILEMRRVVEVKPERDSMFSMRLLKKEVGELALRVIMEGEVSTQLVTLPGASIISYEGPEQNRAIQRKQQTPIFKRSVGDLLDIIRSGGLSS